MGQEPLPRKVNSHDVTFEVRTVPGREVPLGAGTSPEGMLLRDVTSTSACVGDFDPGRLKLEVLAAGRVLAEVRPIVEHDADGETIFRFDSHLEKGILVFRGERVCLRAEGPQALLVTVGALIEGSLA